MPRDKTHIIYVGALSAAIELYLNLAACLQVEMSSDLEFSIFTGSPDAMAIFSVRQRSHLRAPWLEKGIIESREGGQGA